MPALTIADNSIASTNTNLVNNAPEENQHHTSPNLEASSISMMLTVTVMGTLH